MDAVTIDAHIPGSWHRGHHHAMRGAQMATLYERLGGMDAIRAVADSFVARAAGDDQINAKFARTDVPHLKQNFVDQLCEATGGPCTYTGRGMREAHDGMGVTAGEFDAFMQDLEGSWTGSTSPGRSIKSCWGCCCRCVMRSWRSSRRRRGRRFSTPTRTRRELNGTAPRGDVRPRRQGG
jgi:hemoglobin